jgi:hypothetical protein
MGEIELKFGQIIFCVEDRAYMIVYQNDENFQFCDCVPEILHFKHHEIQEFAKNYRISEMKINKYLFFNIMIWVRIDPPHPLVCHKRRLNGAVLRVRPEKPRSRVTAGVAR